MKKSRGTIDLFLLYGVAKVTVFECFFKLYLYIGYFEPNFTSYFPKTLMLRWSIIFLIIALVAALLGFSSIAGTAIGIAKVLFFVFMVLFIITLIAGGLFVKKVKNTINDTFTPNQ